jgi:hypothetical protein
MAGWLARLANPLHAHKRATARANEEHTQLMDEVSVFRAEARQDFKDAAIKRASLNPFVVVLARDTEERR